jgi:hypothetical protein
VSMSPDFIVIGAMKCATSTLHDQLAAQAGIFMSDPKEPNFFSDDDQWEKGWSWYQGLFEGGKTAALRGESSTHYTKLPTYPDTVDRIHQCLPEARFVYLMRDPVDRLVSQFIHEWSERTIVGPIDEAIDRYPRLIDYSLYATQLHPYLDTFGTARVLPVFFESLRNQPMAELDRIVEFLGFEGKVSWQPDPDAANVSLERMRKNSLRDYLVDQPLLARLRRRLVPKSFRERVKGLWRMSDRPVLSEAVRKRVEAEIDRDLENLSRWIGMDLRCTNFAESAASATPSWTEAAPGAGLE